MEGLMGMIGVEVGKHLGNLQGALPLRSVCKDWAETIALGVDAAELDLMPGNAYSAALTGLDGGDATRRARFFRRCPFVRALTYHVAPSTTFAEFEAVLTEAGARLPLLESLTLEFNNAAQRLETRHLAAIAAAAPRLRALALRADFHPDACSFAALAPLAALRELRLVPGEGCAGLSDAHVSSLAGLPKAVERLEFPGHARAFTGATLRALAALPRLARLAVLPAKPMAGGAAAAAVGYTLDPAAVDEVAALARRRGPKAPALDLEIGVPDASWVPRLLAAAADRPAHAGGGLGRVWASVREAATAEQVAAIAAAAGAAAALAGLEVAFGGAPERADLDAIARLSGLERLTITSKCVRPPSARLDVAAALAPLRGLRSLHLHINPQWRAPLAADAVAALASAWPRLERLHIRLGGADGGLGQLFRFQRLRSLSLQWLGDDASAAPPGCTTARGGRRASFEVPVLQLGCLPRSLEELSLTSISSVRLSPPAPYDPAYMAAPPLGALRALALDGNFGLNDALLPALAAQLPALRSLALVLAGRQQLTSAGLAATARALPEPSLLASLLVTDYREGPLALDQGCLDGLAPRLARLRHLKLSTPDVVHAALRPECFAPFLRLRRLELVGCQQQAAAALARALPLCCFEPRAEWPGEAGAVPAATGEVVAEEAVAA